MNDDKSLIFGAKIYIGDEPLVSNITSDCEIAVGAFTSCLSSNSHIVKSDKDYELAYQELEEYLNKSFEERLEE